MVICRKRIEVEAEMRREENLPKRTLTNSCYCTTSLALKTITTITTIATNVTAAFGSKTAALSIKEIMPNEASEGLSHFLNRFADVIVITTTFLLLLLLPLLLLCLTQCTEPQFSYQRK